MENLKGIIFDFNGVLLWDSHLHERAWKEYSKKIRGTEFSDEEMVHHVHGRTNKDILEYATGKQLNGSELENHTQGKETTYRDFCLQLGDDFKLAPGAIEFLDYLKEKNIPRTIATASEITNLKFFYDNLHLDKWFDFDLIVYDDGTIPGKPAPDLYLKAAEKLKLKPGDCLVVEDSRSGIASANNAKIGTIIALGSRSTHDTLLSLPGVTFAIEDFFELLSILENKS